MTDSVLLDQYCFLRKLRIGEYCQEHYYNFLVF